MFFEVNRIGCGAPLQNGSEEAPKHAIAGRFWPGLDPINRIGDTGARAVMTRIRNKLQPCSL